MAEAGGRGAVVLCRGIKERRLPVGSDFLAIEYLIYSI